MLYAGNSSEAGQLLKGQLLRATKNTNMAGG
jgi:hypothetical protein